jgi:hypothetical protein
MKIPGKTLLLAIATIKSATSKLTRRAVKRLREFSMLPQFESPALHLPSEEQQA